MCNTCVGVGGCLHSSSCVYFVNLFSTSRAAGCCAKVISFHLFIPSHYAFNLRCVFFLLLFVLNCGNQLLCI